MEQNFWESDKSGKHELGSDTFLLSVYCWRCGNILVSYTRGCRLVRSFHFKYFFTELDESVKTFRETQISIDYLQS